VYVIKYSLWLLCLSPIFAAILKTSSVHLGAHHTTQCSAPLYPPSEPENQCPFTKWYSCITKMCQNGYSFIVWVRCTGYVKLQVKAPGLSELELPACNRPGSASIRDPACIKTLSVCHIKLTYPTFIISDTLQNTFYFISSRTVCHELLLHCLKRCFERYHHCQHHTW